MRLVGASGRIGKIPKGKNMLLRVIRGTGDKRADNIIDPLCTSRGVARQRGRNCLDEEGFNKTQYNLDMPYTVLPLPGQVVQVDDASIGESFKAKVAGWSLKVTAQTDSSPVSVDVAMTLERSEA